ncbi:YitT family protein [Paenibacillus arenilitoris]|uniref:YitT family protein n=1 Tax=Paenibacillus arenilitoris TaxID=2772299 RepID=A0A927CKF8_9BACL|nr:YitT family protein [Paenibacillus arenilitoris]MBD2869684.1 YitT family protein [Paenibacillus arenilitoris]
MSKIIEQSRIVFPILIGTAIYAFGLHYFVIPNQLMEGGATGIAVLLNYAAGWPLSITTLLLNVPLFLIGWKALGRGQMMYTLLGIVSLSAFLALMERLIETGLLVPFRSTQDYMLAALYAGVSLGTGLGIVFRFGGTTGGVDIVARIVARSRGISMGQIILTLDAVIIGASLFYIPMSKVLYTLVTVFIASKLIDFIQDGAYAAKAFSIITDHGEEISKQITIDLERGVTLIPARGVYSGQQKEVVYCVVQRQEIRRLKTIVRSIDPRAFIIINEVHDVLGEGFKEE